MIGIKNEVTNIRSVFLESSDNIKLHLNNVLIEHLKTIKESTDISKKELKSNSQKTIVESKLFLIALIIIAVTNLLIVYQLMTTVKKINDLELNQINLTEKMIKKNSF
jgi:hypothetical protein